MFKYRLQTFKVQPFNRPVMFKMIGNTPSFFYLYTEERKLALLSQFKVAAVDTCFSYFENCVATAVDMITVGGFKIVK